jgi:membrane protein required for colicin V production
MWIDVAGLVIVLLLGLYGYGKGVILSLFSIVGFIVGLIASVRLGGWLASELLQRGWVLGGWSLGTANMILFVGFMFLMRILGHTVKKMAGVLMLGWADKLVGGVLFASFGLVLWSGVLWIGHRMHMLQSEDEKTSVTYSYLVPVAPVAARSASSLLPLVKQALDSLTHFFDEVDKALPHHVDPHR